MFVRVVDLLVWCLIVFLSTHVSIFSVCLLVSLFVYLSLCFVLLCYFIVFSLKYHPALFVKLNWCDSSLVRHLSKQAAGVGKQRGG